MFTEHPSLISFFGLFVMMFLAWLLSDNRRAVSLRTVGGGLLIQFALAWLILKTHGGQSVFAHAQDVIVAFCSFGDLGAEFVFGQDFRHHFFAFKVLPTIIFVSACSYLLFYWGILQHFVNAFSWIMNKTMGISGVDGVVSAASVFCGISEAPLFVRPYIKTMSRSEIMTMMVSGMATVAGGVMAAYIGFGISGSHLLAASLMSAPAAIVIAKIMSPETATASLAPAVQVTLKFEESNALEAVCVGACEGLKMALNIAAVIITMVALVGLSNALLGRLGQSIGVSLSLEKIFAYAFWPLAFVMGVPWQECHLIAQLLGERTVLNELIAYGHLAEGIKAGALSERASVIATYALCGFANIAAIAVQVGGIAALEPSRRREFAAYGLRAMIGGTLASFMTACIAGMLF